MNRGAWTDMMFGGGPHVVDDEPSRPDGPVAGDAATDTPSVESQPAWQLNEQTWDVPVVTTMSVLHAAGC